MLLESVLMLFLIATLVMCFRMHIDLQKLKIYKEDFNKILKKVEIHLTDLEKMIERFRHINTSEKDELRHITNSAKIVKEDLSYLTEKSENIFQKLSAGSKTIRIDRNKEAKISEATLQINSKKDKLIKTIKDLR